MSGGIRIFSSSMTQFCAGFTVSEASTYLSDAGGGEVKFLHVTSDYSRFV